LQFVKNIKTWQLILILIPLLFLTATFLRFDHLKMNELKEAVYAADAAGEDENGNLPEGVEQKSQEEITKDIEEKMLTLKKFTESHTIVNFVEKNGKTDLVFGTGPFYLEHQYNRLAAKAIAEAEQKAAEMSDDNPNGNIFYAAMQVCKPQAIANGWVWNSPGYIACMTGEINSHPTTETLTTTLTANIPSTALFRYDFASPVWSFTLSGLLMLICIILIVWIFIRLLVWFFLSLALIFLK